MLRVFAVSLLAVGVGACAPAATGGAAGLPQTVIFDGSSLDGWEMRGDARWTIQDGAATAVPGTGDGFLVTNRDYGDFRMTVDFWADATANGGIYLRVPAVGPGVNPSYEVNIMDSHESWPTGSINTVAKNENPNTTGRWNSFDITVRGNRVTVLLNGVQVADGEAARPPRGRIALQKLGEGVIRYRNVRVEELN